MAVSNQVKNYARMWPREVFDYQTLNGNKKKALAGNLEFLDKPGVYVLYREDVPYYIGKAKKLRHRIRYHSSRAYQSFVKRSSKPRYFQIRIFRNARSRRFATKSASSPSERIAASPPWTNAFLASAH
jgi:predicted GIY-YIG superfamily endonuclease